LFTQDSPHDCCKRSGAGPCGTPSSKQPAEKKCPNQSLALENYTKVELETGHTPVLPVWVSWFEALPAREVVIRVAGHPPLGHAPPDLYLLHSILVI
jgi:hypothetical protein